ncbi:hypothetical protein SVAN01_00834 [Stagonosporopsis vannaccii]|nr:hypothetical protein SVAN01_00834 [Stagonosporopsis vannaccii]
MKKHPQTNAETIRSSKVEVASLKECGRQGPKHLGKADGYERALETTKTTHSFLASPEDVHSIVNPPPKDELMQKGDNFALQKFCIPSIAVLHIEYRSSRASRRMRKPDVTGGVQHVSSSPPSGELDNAAGGTAARAHPGGASADRKLTPNYSQPTGICHLHYSWLCETSPTFGVHRVCTDALLRSTRFDEFCTRQNKQRATDLTVFRITSNIH